MTNGTLRTIATLATAALGLSLTPPAFAADGVIEINQACAEATGCFPGDAPGFPVRITEIGSYRLTGDLSVPSGTNGIRIDANGENGPVTLDLGGFAVSSTTVCTNTGDTGSTISCSGGSGAQVGIEVAAKNVTVRNGTVRGFNWRGIGNSGHQGNVRLEGLRVTSNAAGGTSCGAINFDDSPNVTIVDTEVIRNGACRAITLTNGGKVIDSIVSENLGEGLWTSFGNHLVRGNIFRANAQSAVQLDQFGSGDQSLVQDNVIVDNGVNGVQGLATIKGNVINNNGGTLSGSIVEIGTNLCNGNTTCP